MRLALAVRLPVGMGLLISAGIGSPQSWHWQNPLPQGNEIINVFFVDANHGWATGQYGTIQRTTDGGATWISSLCE